MNATNEQRSNRQGETMAAVEAHDLEAVEGGYAPRPDEWCGHCRNPLNPSNNPMGVPRGWPRGEARSPFTSKVG
jgi:hypothetical protein